MHTAEFYMRDLKEPPSPDLYLIHVVHLYTWYHSCSDEGKKRFHTIMRYLLLVELILTLLSNDKLPLWMLVVRIMVLTCAFFNEELIPSLIKMLWTMGCDNAPKVWQWLCDNAPKVWQWLREQWHLWRPPATQQPAQAQAPAQIQEQQNVRGRSPAVRGRSPAVRGRSPAVRGRSPAVRGRSPARSQQIEGARAYLRGFRDGRSHVDPPDILRQAIECSVCLQALDLLAIVPCGHRCVCEACAATLTQGCPLCRRPIKTCIQVYDP